MLGIDIDADTFPVTEEVYRAARRCGLAMRYRALMWRSAVRRPSAGRMEEHWLFRRRPRWAPTVPRDAIARTHLLGRRLVVSPEDASGAAAMSLSSSGSPPRRAATAAQGGDGPRG